MIKINGIELELDIFDAETAEIYEDALDEVKNQATVKDGAKMSDMIRTQCNAVFNFFDEVFGEGTSKEVFGEKTNLMECLRAFEIVIEYVSNQTEEAKKMTDKYSPNRAQRRAKR